MINIIDFIKNKQNSFSSSLSVASLEGYITEIDDFLRQYHITICYDQNFDHFKPLIAKTNKIRHSGSLFDTDLFPFEHDTGIFLAAFNQNGDCIASTAAKNFQWQEGETLDSLFPTLPPFFIDPADNMSPDKVYFCNTFENSHIITGNHVYCGATWVREDYRHLLLSMIIPRLIKRLAAYLWNHSVTWGIVGQSNFKNNFHLQYGLPNTFPIQTRFLHEGKNCILNDYIAWSDKID